MLLVKVRLCEESARRCCGSTIVAFPLCGINTPCGRGYGLCLVAIGLGYLKLCESWLLAPHVSDNKECGLC